ncbi:unnamed protein product [Orchesella dallaii]|uniref:DOMON domain-containing protein n=1 Tax=Orchesella dallaii TaxID=48710 RepID=A0ABP1QGG6_9HEXA
MICCWETGISLCSLLLAILSCCSEQVEGFKGTVFQFTHELSLPSGIKVRWTTSDQEWITFEMSSPTNGYVGIGFSHTGNMAGSDIYIGWVDSSGKAHIKDYFGTANAEPVEDQQQDVELLAASENEHGTMIVFKRKYDTCDHRDYIIGDDTIFLLWAWGADDPNPATDNRFHLSYHGSNELSRGAKGIRLTAKQIHWKFPDEEEKYPHGIQQYDFVNSDVQVPKADTYHHCKIIKFPQLQQKHHILAHKIVLTPDSREHIHRIVLHKCHIPQFIGLSEESILENYVDLVGWNCYGAEYPSDLKTYCSHSTVAILGEGYEGFKYPDHVGVEIGDTNAATYYRLEIHYQNPDGLYMVDNSGIRVFYSSTLREYESGLLITGHRRTPFMTIPPRQAEFNIYGLCSAECMWNGLNQEGTKILAVQLHSHWIGRRVQLRHIRNGRELSPIVVENHLNANFQEYWLLPREVKIIPGDQLILQCTYETTTNDTVIFGGSAASNEICEAILVYYPKSRLTDCRSQPELYQYLGAVGVMNATGETFRKLNVSYSPDSLPDEFTPLDDSYALESESDPAFSDVLITSPSKLKNRYLHDYLSRLNWGDDFFSKIVEQKWKNGLHYMHCTGNGGKKIPTSSHVVPYPVYEDYTAPAHEPDKCFKWGPTSASSALNSKFINCFIVTVSLVNIFLNAFILCY